LAKDQDSEMEERQQHWDEVYGARSEAELTWYEEQPSLSDELVTAHLRPGGPFIDVGGGASKLTDRLLQEGYGPLAVLDVSPAVLAKTRERLDPRADEVRWIVADITDWVPDATYNVWHDRAVFHFLTEERDQAAYAAAMAKALVPGGTAILGTFAEDGPDRCSGLPVVRYAPEQLVDRLHALAPGAFEAIGVRRHMHVTPKGHRQSFQFSVLRKRRG
jgi:SAM-dependent methyltransferase